VEGDDDEEDIDDIEHEFNIDDERNNNNQVAEAMLHGKMSYGRGPDDEESAQLPPVIAGLRSRPVSHLLMVSLQNSLSITTMQSCKFTGHDKCMQVSGEFPLAGRGGEIPSSLHKRVHPYPSSEPGICSFAVICISKSFIQRLISLFFQAKRSCLM